MKQAMLWDPADDASVRCKLCAHRCLVADGKLGICQVRQNRNGELYSLVYGQVVARAVDPIEKKPLFHFQPGSRSFSVATVGCNFRCTFCQNADIAQGLRDGLDIVGQEVPAEEIVSAALERQCQSIAYTYTEPTIFFEYTYDIGRKAHAKGLTNVYVTNGYMTPEMLDVVMSVDDPPLIDAANVDLKAFNDTYYREQCGARLQPVLDSLKLIKEYGIWLEVTTLIIPGLNDSDDEIGEIAGFISKELGQDTPWHVSRFHPTYRLTDHPPTPTATLHRAREIGLEAGLEYVYTGNIPGQGGEDTVCPNCGQTVIERTGFSVRMHRMDRGHCAACDNPIAGVGL